MRGNNTHRICRVDVEGDRPRVLYLLHVGLPQLLRISALQNIELNIASVPHLRCLVVQAAKHQSNGDQPQYFSSATQN
jgi:hypothetical protein